MPTLAVLLALAAPVPPYRPLSPADVAGEYRLGDHWALTLSPGGGYVCVELHGPGVWEGTWRLDGHTVHVKDRRRLEGGPPGVECDWEAAFPRRPGDATTRWGPMRRAGR